MSVFCLTACSLFDKGDEPDDGEIEVVLSDDSDPFVIRVGASITVHVLSPIGDPIWQSVDPGIATVTDGGVITGVAEGSTFVVVSVGESFTSRTVVVMPAVGPDDPDPPVDPDKETITFTHGSAVSVAMGSSVSAPAVSSKGSTITYSSLNQTVATVNNDGVITGLNVGTTSVIARSSTGATAVCSVTVTAKPVPETITLNRNSMLVYVGDTAELIASTSKGSKATWHSSDPSVATVNNGKITALSVGKTTVSASVPEGAVAECTVNVIKAPDTNAPAKDGYTYTWGDEFNGNSLDSSKWGYQIGIQDNYKGAWGPEFWGNDELQYYTDAAKNVNVSGGALNITAIKEPMDRDRQYSSARILTRDKFSQTYGYFEARMKTPTGSGMWPAFWMLPQPDGSWGYNNEYGGWPHSGEIDIMEAKGRLFNRVDHTIHISNSGNGNHYYLGTSATVVGDTSDWHTYALDWTPGYLKWYVDGELTCHYNCGAWTTQASSAPSAPFDKPFYILFDLAVGGRYDSYNEPDKNFKQATMQIDYVRVYQNNLYA